MEINFVVSLTHVLEHEGGWADHPQDPGGATMKGVTLITYRRHFGDHKSKQDLRSITDQELGHIYRSAYWDTCRCDALAAGGGRGRTGWRHRCGYPGQGHST